MKLLITLASALVLMPSVYSQAGNPAAAEESGNRALFCIGDSSRIETPPVLRIGLEARVDFDYLNLSEAKDEAGFHGRYLNLAVNGNILPELSYHWRQRLNKFGEMKNDVFGATDWIYLDYSPTDRWTVSAGKMVVDVGGYEYDRAPIDVFFGTLYWQNIACYQFGVAGRYDFTGNNHSLTFQFSNSPYAGRLGDKNFGYSLMWRGKIRRFSALWSVNAFQYGNGYLCGNIALGNRFDFGACALEVDFHNRHSRHQKFWLGDFLALGRLNWTINRHFDIFAKGGYEKYRPELGERYTVCRPLYGVGMEYYPLRRSRDLRIHAVTDVRYTIESQRTVEAMVGVTWRMDILNVK